MAQEPGISSAQETTGRAYEWLALLIVSIGTFMSTVDASIINLSLPTLSQVFEVGPSIVLWVSLSYMLILAGLMLPLGRLSDTLGRKRVYTWGFIIFTLGLALSALSQNILQLIFFRVVQGVGAAMIIAVGTALVTATFRPEERGRALGILVAVVGGGLGLGPALGGFLIDTLGWRSIFYLRLPVGVIGSAMAWAFLKREVSPNPKAGFDFGGAATLFGALTAFLLALNQGQMRGWSSPLVLAMGTISLLLLALFFSLQMRVREPMVDLRLFRHRVFAAANATLFISFMARVSVFFLMPFYLIQGLGYSPTKAGLLVALVPLTMFLLSPLTGRLSDRMGSRALCSSGLAIICLGLFLLTRLGAAPTLLEIALSLLAVGVGSSFFESPNMSAIMGAVPREKLGTASALMATLRAVGQSAGLALAGAIFSSQLLYASRLGLPPEAVRTQALLAGFQDALLVALAIGLLGVLVSLMMTGKPQPEKAVPPGAP